MSPTAGWLAERGVACTLTREPGGPPIAERVSHYDPWADTLRIIGTVVRAMM